MGGGDHTQVTVQNGNGKKPNKKPPTKKNKKSPTRGSKPRVQKKPQNPEEKEIRYSLTEIGRKGVHTEEDVRGGGKS